MGAGRAGARGGASRETSTPPVSRSNSSMTLATSSASEGSSSTGSSSTGSRLTGSRAEGRAGAAGRSWATRGAGRGVGSSRGGAGRGAGLARGGAGSSWRAGAGRGGASRRTVLSVGGGRNPCSSSVILASRRTCRSSPENSVASHSRAMSMAFSAFSTLAPRQRTFASSSSRLWRAVKRSWQSAARTPVSLLAAMAAPTPLPQTRIPSSTNWLRTALPIARAKSG